MQKVQERAKKAGEMFAKVYTALALANTTRGIKSTEPDLYFLSSGLTQKLPLSLIYRTAKTPRAPRIRRVCVSPNLVKL